MVSLLSNPGRSRWLFFLPRPVFALPNFLAEMLCLLSDLDKNDEQQ